MDKLYDWRLLPVFKDEYVTRVFNELEMGFPIDEASDHFICEIERFWFLRISEDLCIDMLIHSGFWDLSSLIRLSLEIGNDHSRLRY